MLDNGIGGGSGGKQKMSSGNSQLASLAATTSAITDPPAVLSVTRVVEVNAVKPLRRADAPGEAVGRRRLDVEARRERVRNRRRGHNPEERRWRRRGYQVRRGLEAPIRGDRGELQRGGLCREALRERRDHRRCREIPVMGGALGIALARGRPRTAARRQEEIRVTLVDRDRDTARLRGVDEARRARDRSRQRQTRCEPGYRDTAQCAHATPLGTPACVSPRTRGALPSRPCS